MVEALKPGFYLKFAVCDADGYDLVTMIPARFNTAREFYEQRLFGAHVAATYQAFAEFMAKASLAVTTAEVLTLFSRSNYVPPPPRRGSWAYSTAVVQQAVDAVAYLMTHKL